MRRAYKQRMERSQGDSGKAHAETVGEQGLVIVITAQGREDHSGVGHGPST